MSYDRLAWFYNRYWGREYPLKAIAVLEQIFFTRIPLHAHILDLCCGAGRLTGMLTKLGYRVTGIDLSPRMISYARENAPEAEFFISDARAFTVSATFDGVLSTFESLNHVMRMDEMESVFRNVHTALHPGGLFLFDLLTEEAYATLWGRSSAIVEEDNACVIRGGYDASTRVGRTEITMFRLEGSWQRSDVILFQRCYKPKEIGLALEKAGFSEIQFYDALRSLSMTGDLAIGRIFFSAIKSARAPLK